MSVTQEEVERVLVGIARGCHDVEERLGGEWVALHVREYEFEQVLASIRAGHIRIKPAPTVRPWKPHEGLGKQVQPKGDGHKRGLVISCTVDSVYVIGLWIGMDELFNEWECIAPDGSIGPCGVVEGNR